MATRYRVVMDHPDRSSREVRPYFATRDEAETWATEWEQQAERISALAPIPDAMRKRLQAKGQCIGRAVPRVEEVPARRQYHRVEA